MSPAEHALENAVFELEHGYEKDESDVNYSYIHATPDEVFNMAQWVVYTYKPSVIFEPNEDAGDLIGAIKEIIDEYDVFKALIGPFMDDEGCYCDAKVSLQDLYHLDAKIDKARAFLDKQTESNDDNGEE